MPFFAFFSYAHADNEHSSGKLAEFARLLEQDLQALTGTEENCIFLDNDIEWGEHWRRCISSGLEEAAILIPILSPTYLNRPECRKEYEAFLEKERRTGLSSSPGPDEGLIFPLLYLPLPDESSDRIVITSKERQWVEIASLSFGSRRLRTNANSALIRALANRLIERFRGNDRLAKEHVAAFDAGKTWAEHISAVLRTASSGLLSWPTTLPNGDWLDRKELSTLIDSIRNESSSSHVLTGPPGVGKSALLSMLAKHCCDHDYATLAIKADFLPQRLSTPAAFATHVLGYDHDLADTLIRLSKHRTTVVIIDQMDALADLVDLDSGRLDLLLNLIQRIRNCDNLHLICSSRTFELKHDLRLNALASEGDRSAMALLTLPALSRDLVVSSLASSEIDAANWPSDYLQFLAIPYHLRVFLQHLSSVPAVASGVPEPTLFVSIHHIHEARWREAVTGKPDGDQRSELLKELARRIAATECLFQPVSSFDSYGPLIEGLSASGWLHRNGGVLGFAHQTQYEFVLARRFADNPPTFLEHIRKHQDGLFVRPLLWHTLNYLRPVNPSGFLRVMQALLADPPRRHLRYLLYDFLAQVPDPCAEEVTWVSSLLADPQTYPLMAYRLWNHEGWFNALSPKVLPGLMSARPEQCWPVAYLLERSWKFGAERIRQLVRELWFGRPEFAKLVWQVCSDSSSFDAELVQWLCWAVRAGDISSSGIAHTAKQISESNPTLAPVLLAVGLNRQLDVARATDASEFPVAEEDLEKVEYLLYQVRNRRLEKVRREIECHDWYGADELAKASPQAFLQEIWPWFIRTLSESDFHELRIEAYRHENGFDSWFDREYSSRYELPQAVCFAVCALAREDEASFRTFCRTNRSIDSLAVQDILAHGLLENATRYADLAFELMIADTRRFLLGNVSNGTGTTAELLKAFAPVWSVRQNATIQQLISRWNPFAQDASPDQHFSSRAFDFRARLLRVIPAEYRIPDTDGLLAAAMILNVDSDRESTRSSGMRCIVSPASASDFTSMSTPEILSLFDVLTDDTDTQHPHDWRWGGSVQASHEFRKFSAANPEHATEIIRQFRAKEQERPAGEGLVGLSEAKVAPPIICDLIRELVERGFNGSEFCNDAAEALSTAAIANGGLSDDVCNILREWLFEVQIIPDDSAGEVRPSNSEDHVTSVIWNDNRMIMIPHAWYRIGLALKLGYVLQVPPKTSDWIKCLERCVERPFPTKVWCTWLWDLTHHFVPDYPATAVVIESLLRRRTDVFASDAGVTALAFFSNWFDSSCRHSLLVQLEALDWNHASQAAGEISALWMLRDDDRACHERIAQVLSVHIDEPATESFRLGVAFAAANLWTEPTWRREAAEILAQLSLVRSASVAGAITTAFLKTDCLIADDSTHRLLTAMADHFDFSLVPQNYWMTRHLIDLLPHESETILRLCQRMVMAAKESSDSHGVGFGASMSHLVAISLTLHRSPINDIRSGALTLFEDLLELGAYGAADAILELDQRPRPTRRFAAEL